MTYQTKEGITLRVLSTMYVDWGLEITGPDGEELFYSPCALSFESYGSKPPNDMDWDVAEAAGLVFEPWTDEDWRETLEAEADDLIDALVSYAWTGRNGETHYLYGWDAVPLPRGV